MPIKIVGVIWVACQFVFYSMPSLAKYYSQAIDAVTTEYVGNDETDLAFVERLNLTEYELYHSPHEVSGKANYASRLPNHINVTGKKIIVVDPHVHAWGAYNTSGQLIRAGLATAGGKWCNDIDRPCRTKVGVFRIYSLGNSDCISSLYPVNEGGAPMPYCMFFNGGQGLHGSDHLAEANVSHGCVRISVNDAEWLRYNFAQIGTTVIIWPY